MGKITQFTGSCAFLSNFYPCLIEGRGGLTYQSVEHAYQAEKPPFTEEGEHWVNRIQCASTPGKAKKLGQKCPLRDDWTAETKIATMYGLCLQKFNQDLLKGMLLETEDEQLIEGNYWHDTFWGTCYGVGDNHLGEILMNIRDGLRGDR
jgi:ribA/ribD-fused uncharacterized protein